MPDPVTALFLLIDPKFETQQKIKEKIVIRARSAQDRTIAQALSKRTYSITRLMSTELQGDPLKLIFTNP